MNFAPWAESLQITGDLDRFDDFPLISKAENETSSFVFSHRPIQYENNIFLHPAMQGIQNLSSREGTLFNLASLTSEGKTNSLMSLTGEGKPNSADSFSSLSRSSLSRSRSLRLTTHTASEVTVLMIDIQGFTVECASLTAGRVGEWVAAFYSTVDAAAAAYGVRKVAVKGDCCICVAGLEGAVSSAGSKATDAAVDRRCDQASRILAFAAALHSSLATLDGGGRASTATRMGVATGEVTFLLGSAAAGSEAAPFVAVQGDIVDVAAKLEARATPGRANVHRSTALRWAAEAYRPPPATELVGCEGPGQQRAAVFDCTARAFLPLSTAAPRKVAAALRRVASATF